jgi:N-acetylmuramoyl-L-alanine amidase
MSLLLSFIMLGHHQVMTPPELKPITMTMEVTAYTAHCPGCSGVTTTGIDLIQHPDSKVVAVDPNVVPLGSTLFIPGYGQAVAADTGGAINGDRLDVFIPSLFDANEWGRQTLDVEILN